MPNIYAHNHISAQVYGPESVDIMLGSTLPDFAGMYNARFGGRVALSLANPDLEFGAGFHKLTDQVYDAQTELPQMTEPLREHLIAVGIPYKAARLTTAFAADVLVDRALLDIDAARDNFDSLRNVVMHGGLPELGSLDERLTKYIRRYFAGYVPCEYKDPHKIAAMARHRLYARGNQADKRITEQQVPAVAEILGEHADRIGELGLRALFGTLQELNAPVKEAEVTPKQLQNFSRRVKQATILERAFKSSMYEDETIELHARE